MSNKAPIKTPKIQRDISDDEMNYDPAEIVQNEPETTKAEVEEGVQEYAEQTIVAKPIQLLNYQIPHAEQMKESIRMSKCVLDASDTGTGKTYVAISVCKDLGYSPFVICPKSVIPSWLDVAKKFGIKLFGIANYELLKGCKYYTENYEKVVCPFMDIIQTRDSKSGKMANRFQFMLPQNTMVIFDEAHRCKNHKSITSMMLRDINRCQCKIMLLSATISDKIQCFKPFGQVFGFYDDINKYKIWMRKAKVASKIYYSKKNYTDDQVTLDIIHNRIFPTHGSRMRISELGDMFPQNQVTYQSYMCENKDKIQEQYDIIREAFDDLRNKEMRSEALGKLIRARMKVEMFKMPIMLDIIAEALDSNYSVVIFVNYRESMEYLAHYFETDCLIHGEQTLEDRQDSIDAFQSNRSKIIISIMQAGGVGISLHDIHGGHPRMSVISPTWSGQDMMQALGRIHRAGSQSPALQRIVYCAETYEEEICKLIEAKMINITALNDKNFLGPGIEEEIYEELEKDLEKAGSITSADQIATLGCKEDGAPGTTPDSAIESDPKYNRIIKKEKRKKYVKVVKTPKAVKT